MYYLAETRIAPATDIRRERILPARGDVLVRPGESVGPADVVARCQMPGGIEVVDVSRALGTRRDRAAKWLLKNIGDTVQANEVLASHGGLLGRLKPVCRAPVGGQVIAVREGLVLIEKSSTTFELRAHLQGQVTNIMPGLGVVIATRGVLIQGMWGSGGEADGVLKILVDNPRKPLRARAIDVSCHGTIVVGGSGLDDKALEQAVEAKVRGIIVGSINADLCPVLHALPIPVLVTDGFGSYPMSQTVFSLLQSNAGRETGISADATGGGVRWGKRRPEVVIPLRSESSKEDLPEPQSAGEQGALQLRPNAQVRVLRAPYLGAVGTVTDLPAQLLTVESGVRLPVVEVALEGAELALIPIANLELIQ